MFGVCLELIAHLNKYVTENKYLNVKKRSWEKFGNKMYLKVM